MINILLAFVTGLTTGGLSCLAVQGGLLASSLASQIEKDFQTPASKTSRKHRDARLQAEKRAQLSRPILAFLAAKILAYTVLGFLLGLVGQVFQLSPIARALLQVAIGVFMLGSALRMLNVHPIFRYFVFEPPAFLRRMLRKKAASADDASLATPAFLGLMTVLIPCGITQAMMAAALGAADPIQGAALMFAFTLGTSPVFFAVAYFATQLGARLEKHFTRFVAVVVLVLAIVTIDSGMTLAGSPYSLSRLARNLFSPPESVQAAQAQETPQENSDQELGPASGPTQPQAAAPEEQGSDSGAAASAVEDNVVTINVKNGGYQPQIAHAKAGVPVKLRLVTQGVQSCSRAIYIPALNVQQILEATGEATIEIPAQAQGTEMPYSCSMGMFSGMIVFDR